MKSNDRIPDDEMLLAEAYAAAQCAELEWTMGAPFRNEDEEYVVSPSEATSCCALGALHIAGCIDLKSDITMPRKSPLANVHAGNDRPVTFGWLGTPGDNGESLGWAFRCAMTQDVSDPTIERLIAERSGK